MWKSEHEALRTVCHEQGNDQCLLMVNPTQYDVFADNEFVQDHKVIVPIEHPRFDLKSAPYLVPLDLKQKEETEILQYSVQLAYEDWSQENLEAFLGQSICGWALTQTPAKEVATYWAKNTFVHRHNNLDKLLRWHDPGVRDWLWPLLYIEQRHQLIGPVEYMYSINRQQTLTYQAQPREAPSSTGPLQLSETQWQAVENFALLHAAWVSAWVEDEHFKDRLTGSANIKAHLESLEAAKQMGIHHPDKLKQFLMLAWRYHPDFYRIEPYNQLVDKLLPNN